MARRRPAAALLLVASVLAAVALPGAQADAAPKCRTRCADVTLPSVTIGTPSSGASVSGTVGVSGTSSDNAAVSSVAVSVDGGAWTTASGTSSWSWSWSTTGLANGSHSIAARAVDSSGNTRSTAVTVTVANPVPEPAPATDTTAPSVAIGTPASGATVAGTVTVAGSAADDSSLTKVEVRVDAGSWLVASGSASWSWSWATSGVGDGSHTLSARATDASGNIATVTRSVTVSNAPPQTGVWTSPEGVKIDIQTTTGGWSPDEIYAILTAGARDLTRIGPGLRIVVQDTKPTLTSIAASSANGRYTSVSATIQLDARSTSTFANRPDDILTHEFGHVWFNYYAYVKWQGDWSGYLTQRWTTSDGSSTLASDSRTGTSYSWTPDEIAADDYRLLFGSPLSISERNTSLNQQIPDPRNQSGLRDWLLQTWAA